jgi:DNA (cytosine-5)-methyltransferase 1
VTRSAPAPTNGDGKNGSHRLSAHFVEWMMGLPEGHVTDVGLTRNEQLKALGNGVVPQQAALALRVLLSREVAA